jgi:hypothetical protein
MAQRILLRRGTSSQWSFYNPVLNAGEPGFDTSNQVLKIGDGTTAWNDLDSYSTAAGGGGSTTNNYYTTFESGVYITGDQLISGEKRFDSFISGNVSGNLSGTARYTQDAVYITGDQTITGVKTFNSFISGNISGNLSGNAHTVTSGVYRTGDQTIGGSKDFVGDLLVSGTNIGTLVSQGGTYGDSNVATYLNGNLDTHIIPDTNSTYDIGSAEYKIRHLYLSDTSLFMGDDNTPIRLNSNNKLTVNDVEVGGAPLVSTVENLPIASADGTMALVTDGFLDNPVLSYFHKGKWFRSTDNSEISDQVVDVYILAGQSNAHGAAQVSTLSPEQSTQDGIFYSSWHEDTSNASSTQYYSDWATSLVAGSTRGDNNTSTLGGSAFFGPELGFVNQANLIGLTNNRPVGVLKHAIGASTLVDETSIVEHNSTTYICIQSNQNTNPSSTKGDYIATLPEPGTEEGNSYWEVTTEPSEGTWSSNGAYYDKGYSDWDLTDTGDRRGDALRAFKLAVADGINKLTQANYGHRIAGLIWWQGESGSSVDGLNALIAHIRTWLDDNGYLDVPKSEFPVVITKIGYGTDLTPVADADAYVGIVDAAVYGHSSTQNHVGTDADESYDTNNNGINDMFEIGQAYADQMQLAKSGSTNAAWEPSAIEPNVTLWLDMDDQTTLTQPADYVISIQDKSTNAYTFTPEAGATLTAVDLAQNNKNILRFDGNTDSTNQTGVAFDTTKSLKWYFVLKVVESSAQDTVMECLGGRAVILFNQSGAGAFKGDWYTNANIHISGSTNSNLLNQWVMLAVEWDIPNLTQRAWLNGTQYGGDVANAQLSTFGTSQQVRFGRHQTSQFSDAFDLGEVIFTEDISQVNSQKIEGYLAHKWGLTADLPSSHPFKTSAP